VGEEGGPSSCRRARHVLLPTPLPSRGVRRLQTSRRELARGHAARPRRACSRVAALQACEAAHTAASSLSERMPCHLCDHSPRDVTAGLDHWQESVSHHRLHSCQLLCQAAGRQALEPERALCLHSGVCSGPVGSGGNGGRGGRGAGGSGGRGGGRQRRQGLGSSQQAAAVKAAVKAQGAAAAAGWGARGQGRHSYPVSNGML